MKTAIKTFYKESAGGLSRAEVFHEDKGFLVDHYDFNGRLIMTSAVPDQRTAEIAAEDWVTGYRNL